MPSSREHREFGEEVRCEPDLKATIFYSAVKRVVVRFYFDFEEDGEKFAKIEFFTQEVNQRIKRTMLMVISMMKDIILFFLKGMPITISLHGEDWVKL